MNELKWSDEYPNLFNNQVAGQLLLNPLIAKDIWKTVDDLGLEVNKHDSHWTLNFEPLHQDWLKLLTKFYILIKHKSLKTQTLVSTLYTLKKFSLFLKEASIYNFNNLDNQTFDDFDYYLRSQSNKLSPSTISTHYGHLSVFFNTCRVEGWLNVNTYWFQGRCYFSKPKLGDIDYIPEEVWNQLQENIHLLPEQIQRMVLVIRATGLRIGELLNLPFDCLRKRNSQWRLRLKETEKYEIEDELPIEATELVTIIKEQQNYIKTLFGDSYQNLFCSHIGSIIKDSGWEFQKTVPKVMCRFTFNKWLNILAKKVNICSKSGQLWHFKSHQFRKTLATILTNAGVRDLIIQKYLRHRSPDMQNYYKHLMKQVIGEEYSELIKEKKYVDISGKVVTTVKPNNPLTELMRRKMHQITTQYGVCHRPNIKSPCQTINACLRCEHWRVTNEDLVYLELDLQRAESELKTSQELGMIRQQQGLLSDINNLKNIIFSLS